MDRTAVAAELLSAPLGLQFLQLVSGRNLSLLTDAELLQLVALAQSQISVYVADYEERRDALTAERVRFARLADSVVRRAEHWWDDLDRSEQGWLGGAQAPTPSMLKVDLDAYGVTVPKPTAALWTSTLMTNADTVWQASHGSNEAGPHYGPTVLWNIRVADSARVFEVRSPVEWATLARDYASPTVAYRWSADGSRTADLARVDPDWALVARDWDAVHLSLGGLLTAHDVPVRAGGSVAELRGWDSESTVWFRWGFSSVRSLATLQ